MIIWNRGIGRDVHTSTNVPRMCARELPMDVNPTDPLVSKEKTDKLIEILCF